jgi:AraC-like DNA-binding protein
MDPVPRPTETVAHASALGRWRLVRARPAPALRPFVLDYQDYAEHGIGPVARRELPTTVIPLILTFRGGFRIGRPDAGPVEPLPPAFLAGVHTGPVVVASTGPVRCVQVDFTPIGARRFLGMPLAALRDRVLDLETLLEGEAGGLAERLADAAAPGARFDLLDNLIGRRIAAAPNVPPVVEQAWSLMLRQGGAVRVGALAATLGRSRQAVHAAFRAELGVSPKTAAAILRFERSLRLLERAPATGLAGIALRAGYADQAHFNRDFKRFAGAPPTTIARRRLADGTGLIEPA